MHLMGNMMQVPLLISSILTHAARTSPEQRIIEATGNGTLSEMTYAQFEERVKRLATGLRANGVQPGARVGTLAWNTTRHLELYYAVSGIGSVCHTINPRLHLDQIAYIINHAQDDLLFFDPDFAETVAALQPLCPDVRHWVALTGDATDTLQAYDAWLHAVPDDFAWPLLDENTASGLCYTSGTTGHPKGALYSHRSTVLHALSSCHPDALSMSCSDRVMPVVPMFHVNAWGLPYSALLSGAAIVLPGADLSGKALHALCEAAGVTLSAGVPTVWQGLIDHIAKSGLPLSTLREIMIGGVACPAAMIRAFQQMGVEVRHAWGMTEVSPLGTVCRLMPHHATLDEAAQLDILSTQGRPLFGADFALTQDTGEVLPHDGQSSGHLMIRGPWVIERYFRAEDSAAPDGWFDTGDVATIDANGYLQIRDRSKDVIKSGGEWISSIELENIALEHPAIAQAACIAEPSEKWGERPLLALLARPGSTVTAEDVLALYSGRIARWAIPDRAVFVDEMPMTATGKIKKAALREMCL
ncbi:long-chain-fatty-acid--CoA ligase [Sedimentitalea sp. HM32M-2]|uniref:long-chain-fatty-acid--CoA ligase n=1 Tax=Sedimentitalea sp. HM32M-2 TaxID=3351566 RepID=UPI003635CFE8